MKIVAIDSVPREEYTHVREGIFHVQRLLTGQPDTPANFLLQLSILPNSYYSPRHRHNFDQYRYQIKGEFDFGSDGGMGPGDLAYFPEGTYYGPQTSSAASETLVLQFGGASGSGYVSSEQYAQAMKELAIRGSFAKGVYTRTKDNGTRVNQDAYEAVWEHVNGRQLEYPRPRYGRPVFTQPDHFAWRPLPAHTGVGCKLLGVFSERGTRAALYRVDKGATLTLQENGIYFVINGTGTIAGGRFTTHTTIHVQRGDQAIATANEDSELLQLGLSEI